MLVFKITNSKNAYVRHKIIQFKSKKILNIGIKLSGSQDDVLLRSDCFRRNHLGY